MKNMTKNDYLECVNKVVLYIEQNYQNNLTLEELSKVASFSKYHFHRVFKSIMHQNLGEYIKRVRLNKSTLKIMSNNKITQIALDSGYETNSSFSKAFQKYFKMTPREFSKNIKSTKGAKMQEPKIIDLKPVEVLYVKREGNYMNSSKEAWGVLMDFAYKQKMIFGKNIMGDDTLAFGIAHDNPEIEDENKLRYDACISWEDKSIKIDNEIQSKIINGGKHAIFLHEGAYENLSSTYDMITEWIISNGIKVEDSPMFAKYLNKDPIKTKPEDLKTEICVPIK